MSLAVYNYNILIERLICANPVTGTREAAVNNTNPLF